MTAIERVREILQQMREQTARPDVRDGGYTYSWKPDHWADEIEAALRDWRPYPTVDTRVFCAHCERGFDACPHCGRDEWRIQAKHTPAQVTP